MFVFCKGDISECTNEQLNDLKRMVEEEFVVRAKPCRFERKVHGVMNWGDIHKHSQNGTLDEILCEEDTFDVTLTTGEDVQFVATQDAKGKWFFVLKDALNDRHVMNDECTSKDGYEATKMRRRLKEVFEQLPFEIRNIIKDTEIVQVVDGVTHVMRDKLFLLSYTQVFGGDRYAKQDVGDSQLNCFKRERDRIKECGNEGTFPYWLRSAYSGAHFVAVYHDGSGGNAGAHNAYGVVFGFCI